MLAKNDNKLQLNTMILRRKIANHTHVKSSIYVNYSYNHMSIIYITSTLYFFNITTTTLSRNSGFEFLSANYYLLIF